MGGKKKEKRKIMEQETQQTQTVQINIHPSVLKKSSQEPTGHGSVNIQFSQTVVHSQGIKNKQTTGSSTSVKFSKSMKAQMGSTSAVKQQPFNKRVLLLYTSGSSGANQHLYIIQDYLKSKLKQNQYLCDEQMLETLQDPNYLITPQQQNGTRILYKIQQMEKIQPSINVTLDTIRMIAQRIWSNYSQYQAFIILCGFDVICHISTILSFMFQNLSKLIIFTGGYFPISYMRNDTVNNLIESFAIISMADNFNDVIIVCKNKGYRSNRSIKMKEGDFGSVTSPNIQPLVSVNIKIKFREHLFLPVPKEPFRIHTDLSCRVGIIKFHIVLSKEALQYELNNPAYDGYVIESYGSSNLPQNPDILNLFKISAEQKNKIFVNVGQPVKKVNTSIMREYLQKFYIYYGGDMTTEAALSKLSYLLSLKLNRSEIKKLIQTNIRGQLTEMKKQIQFQLQNQSFMQILSESLMHYYPLNYFDSFLERSENQLSLFIVTNSSHNQFQSLFREARLQAQSSQTIFQKKMTNLINNNYLLHKSVKAKNQNLYQYFLINFKIQQNIEDEQGCSALFYAVANSDKKAVQYLCHKGCTVECPTDTLFDLLTRQLRTDNFAFYELLYHIEFKQTLREQIDEQGRSLLHRAAALNAQKCLRYLLDKFKFNPKLKDKYERTYLDYLPKQISKEEKKQQ